MAGPARQIYFKRFDVDHIQEKTKMVVNKKVAENVNLVKLQNSGLSKTNDNKEFLAAHVHFNPWKYKFQTADSARDYITGMRSNVKLSFNTFKLFLIHVFFD